MATVRDPYGRNGNTSGFGSGRPTYAPAVYPSDPYGRDVSNTAFGRGNQNVGTSSGSAPAGVDMQGNRVSTSEFTSQFDRDAMRATEYYLTAAAEAEELLRGMQQPAPTSGGGSGYGNLGAMLQGMAGAFGPQQAPQFQQLGTPIMQQVAQMPELQQVQAYQLPEYQQFTPELLQYQDFSPMQQNLTDVAAATRGQINDAFAPLMERMAAPQQTMVGGVTPTAQALSPELAQLAAVQGIGPEYQQALAAANSGIQNNADLFAGRGAMLDRALQGARDMTQSTAQMSQGTALSNAAMQEQLANAALQRMIMQSNAGIDQQNNALTNQAGMANTQGLNDWAMAQATINNNANMANTNIANESAIAMWNAMNNAAATNTGVANEFALANNTIANQQAQANAAAGQPNSEALLQLILQAAGMGQTIDPNVLASLMGGAAGGAS